MRLDEVFENVRENFSDQTVTTARHNVKNSL